MVEYDDSVVTPYPALESSHADAVHYDWVFWARPHGDARLFSRRLWSRLYLTASVLASAWPGLVFHNGAQVSVEATVHQDRCSLYDSPAWRKLQSLPPDPDRTPAANRNPPFDMAPPHLALDRKV